MARNVVNIEEVSKAFDIRPLLERVSLGVSEGDRIGIVGRNGAGKSTMLDALSFALFGKPHRNITKSQIVNSINQKNETATTK